MKQRESFTDQQQKWEKLKKRLEYAKKLVNTSFTENLNHEQVLVSRAEKLALALNDPAESGAYNELILCRLGKEKIAIETQYVREVLRVKKITPVPTLPKFFKGITNIRGEIISVVDLAFFLGIRSEHSTDNDMLVVLQSPQAEFAIQINELIGIQQIQLPYDSIKVATLQEEENNYLKSITTRQNVAVLDMEKIMASPLLQVNQVSENE
jgi:purine-binding chemotaxis protein CheW